MLYRAFISHSEGIVATLSSSRRDTTEECQPFVKRPSVCLTLWWSHKIWPSDAEFKALHVESLFAFRHGKKSQRQMYISSTLAYGLLKQAHLSPDALLSFSLPMTQCQFKAAAAGVTEVTAEISGSGLIRAKKDYCTGSRWVMAVKMTDLRRQMTAMTRAESSRQ